MIFELCVLALFYATKCKNFFIRGGNKWESSELHSGVKDKRAVNQIKAPREVA
jgi:hypothetical protein